MKLKKKAGVLELLGQNRHILCQRAQNTDLRAEYKQEK